MRFEIYKDKNGEWRWHLKAANHEKIATSGEGYKNKADALHAIDLVKSSYNAPAEEIRSLNIQVRFYKHIFEFTRRSNNKYYLKR